MLSETKKVEKKKLEMTRDAFFGGEKKKKISLEVNILIHFSMEAWKPCFGCDPV